MSVIWYFSPCYFFLSYKHLHCQTNVHQFQCSLHTCEIYYLIMGLCLHGRALICKYVLFFVLFVSLFFGHLFISLTIYDGTESCVAGLVDWMTSWSFTNPLWQMKQQFLVACVEVCFGWCYSFRISLCYTQCCVSYWPCEPLFCRKKQYTYLLTCTEKNHILFTLLARAERSCCYSICCIMSLWTFALWKLCKINHSGKICV